ncbi:hypothetical protein PsorP6_011358 [Peronosclerospora sorghi]|uniref:Uncharacterized protein n=1 Tax=Peronosclerospora sorghi TaxID=230839 RepID=A0ACC0WJU7_9STRA|nr:hypothetical protein PsorP6_011358 [Peronosclerospora sorghi]
MRPTSYTFLRAYVFNRNFLVAVQAQVVPDVTAISTIETQLKKYPSQQPVSSYARSRTFVPLLQYSVIVDL